MALDKEKLASLRIDREPARKTRAPWAAIVLSLTALVIAALWWFNRQQAAIQVKVDVAREIGASQAGSVLNASGYVTARTMATVSSKVTGKVVAILIEEGMVVEEGQILARLDDRNLVRQRSLASAQVDAAEAALAETHALLREAHLSLRRVTDLVSKGFATESERDTAQAQAESLEARLATQKHNVEVARRQVDVWDQQIEDTLIRAPFAGVIVSKDAQPGEMISPVSAGGGFTRTGIGTLVDMSSLEIEVDVNEAYINRIVADQRVTANLDAYPDWPIGCHVIAIIPTADRQKATVEVRIGFDKLDDRILPDMGVKVTFHESEQKRREPAPVAALYVPNEAVAFSGSESEVWIVSAGQATRKRIVGAGRDANGYRITSGLAAGDRVITASDRPLEEGITIEVAP